jgi:alpha-glucosidase (family GH31 glycosyl hydrolase)
MRASTIVQLLLGWQLVFVPASAQISPGAFSGYSIEGKAINIRAGTSSIRLIFYAPDVLRVDFLPAATTTFDSSLVVIRDTTENVGVTVVETDSTLELTSSALRARCGKTPVRMSYYDAGGKLLLAEPVSGGFSSIGAMRAASFAIKPDEHFYGTGERGIGLDLRGALLPSYNAALYGYPYTSPPLSMNINVPFLASTSGYALYFENTYPASFDLGNTDPGTFSYTADGGELSYVVMAAPTVREQLERYTWLTGRQPLPPRWAFGFLQSKFGYRNEAEARTMIQTMRQKQIPCDAIILDLYWYRDMGDLSWNLSAWPDPPRMMTDFLAQGIKTIAITEPYITSYSVNYVSATGNGVVAQDASGRPYTLNNWWSCYNCDAVLVDFTNPIARTWWWNLHPSFFGTQLAGVWTDLGEPERHPDDMHHSIGSAARVHNIYNLLWAKTIFDGFSQFRPDRRIFNLTRSGYAGIQRYGVIPWSGDVAKNFAGLAMQLPMMLNMGMSGLAYHNSDIGGFAGSGTTPELYVRWMQYGTFCPITRAHGAGPGVGGQDTEPWAFGTIAEDIVRQYIQLRYRLLPYIYSAAYRNFSTGLPLARPLFFDYPRDQMSYAQSTSYMWGDALLVAPVVQSGQTTRTVYLPEGTWVDYWTDRAYQGGQTVEVPAPLETLPLFVRAASIIPMQPVMSYSDERPLDTLILAVYPSPTRPAAFTLYEDDGTTLQYQRGSYAQTAMTQTMIGSTLQLALGPTLGSYTGKPLKRTYLSDIHGIYGRPTAVRKNGRALAEQVTLAALHAISDGFFYDDSGRRLFIQGQTDVDSSYLFTAENIILSTRNMPGGAPSGFRLEQNYPDPFNPTTTIVFEIPRRELVDLSVFDLLGRNVATLVHETREAGSYSAQWNAADLSTGLYFCRLRAGGVALTRKMILAK